MIPLIEAVMLYRLIPNYLLIPRSTAMQIRGASYQSSPLQCKIILGGPICEHKSCMLIMLRLRDLRYLISSFKRRIYFPGTTVG